MSKLILILAIGILLYVVLTRGKRSGQDAAPRAASVPESMVECAYCHLHLPQGECIEAEGRHYCCEEHRRLGQG